MHSTKGNIVTWTQKPVYGDLTIGKLERSKLVESMLFVPHQQRFDCNSKACFPVAIDYLSAFAFEQGIIVAMPFANSTAVATPFTGVVGINNIECDILVEAPSFKILSELIKRDTQDFSVEILGFGVKSFEVFNTDVSIILQSQISDIPNNLTDTVSDEVPLVVLDLPELLPSVLTGHANRLQPATVRHSMFSTSPNIFPIIELPENPTLRGEDADCETLAVHINSNNILASRQLNIFFGEVSDNLPIRSESICFANPSVLNQRIVSLVVPVLDNGKRNICFGFDSQRHEKPTLGVECLAIAGYVELDGDMFEVITLGFTNTAFDVADNLAVEGGGLLDY